MGRHKRLWVGVCLLAWTASTLAAPLNLGSASRTRMADKHVYLIPISAIIDGYSTFRAVLTSTDDDFLAQTTSEIIKTKKGATLRVFTPLHLDDVVLAVQVDYQGRSTNETYRLKADNVDLIAGIDVSRCQRQWILRGTLVSNIKRILGVCGYVLGEWPMKDVANYVDFVLLEASALPDPGGLPELVDYVRVRFGFAAQISQHSRVVSFIDLTTKTSE